MERYGEVPMKCPLGTVKRRPFEVTVKSFFALRSSWVYRDDAQHRRKRHAANIRAKAQTKEGKMISSR